MSLVDREDHGRVVVLALDRPDRRNALSDALLSDLVEALRAVEVDEGVGAVVLTGRGRVFCAGGDLAGGMSGGGGVLAGHRSREGFADALRVLTDLDKPVIAALNGDAMGGGLGLAMACDLVVAAEAARLGTPEIKLGLFPHVILAVLQRNVPRKKLMEMILTGAPLSAVDAERWGMVNRVVEGDVVEAAVELASGIAARSPAILALGKSGFYHAAELDFDAALTYMNSQLTLNLLTEDAMEGISAFVSKRDPVWKGR